MNLSVGIVGLPNVGKSTLFNALLQRQVSDVAEYPFTTIEPNTGVVKVKDERLDKLSEVLKIKKKVAAVIKFYDIAGLVKGAHKGQGLGNQFLGHIRSVDAILHLVRGFSAEKIPHVSGRVDPVHDLNTINLELALADFELISKALKEKKKMEADKKKVLEKVLKVLESGKLAMEAKLNSEEKMLIKEVNLLTLKPMLYGLNLDESAVSGFSQAPDMPPVMILSAKLEAEINQLKEKERKEYLKQLGLKESLLDRLIKRCYKLLNLITFFTVKGGKQVQAWPLEKGKTVIEAAEMVHTDFAKNFVKTEVIDWQELVKLSSWGKAREKGKLKLAGRDYRIKDGEVIEFITAS